MPPLNISKRAISTTGKSSHCIAGCGPCKRTLELPGKNPLKDAHAAPGAAVLAAYGFSPKADLLAQILELNLAVAARIDHDQPVTAPGLPPTFPEPKRLITDDCIRP